jgi:hypothetical protein
MMQVPSPAAAHVRDLCQKIKAGADPVYIAITPEPGCEVADCFNCIRQKVARDGGRIQFGWALWEWPRVYVEAEHHAVYEPSTGPPWKDITPSALPHISRRLFLPDDTAVYDYANEGIRRENVRIAVAGDPLITELFRLAEERNAILNAIPGVGEVTLEGDTAVRFQHIREQQARVEFQLAMNYTPQNAPCPCGSGQKFKRCHGQRRSKR